MNDRVVKFLADQPFGIVKGVGRVVKSRIFRRSSHQKAAVILLKADRRRRRPMTFLVLDDLDQALNSTSIVCEANHRIGGA